MANILISSLGTGQKRDGGYLEATYSYNNHQETTTFISSALSKMLKIDKLFLVGTSGSIWDSAYREFSSKNNYSEEIELDLYEKIEKKLITEKDLSIVNSTIDSKFSSKGSKCFLIDYGLNDVELWNNFEKYIKILEYVDDNDNVYIDITHAFRSLSLMSFLMVQFGHIIRDKKFKVCGVFYGMLEVSRQNNGITPIVDLKILYDLMEWMKAVDNLKNYANGDNITSLLENSDEMKDEYNIFNSFTKSMRIANMMAIKKNINSISNKIQILKKSNNPIIALMSQEMVKFVNRLNKDQMSDFQIELADWYCEHKHYALSYLALVEAIVTKVCEVRGYEIDTLNGRTEAKYNISSVNRELYQSIYKNANKIRNNIAHQLTGREEATISDINNLPNYIEKTKRIFKSI